MIEFVKRLFVYFLTVTYLNLTLAPSFAFAMEREQLSEIIKISTVLEDMNSSKNILLESPFAPLIIGADVFTPSIFSDQSVTLNGSQGIIVHSANLGSEKSVTLNAGHNKITFYPNQIGSQFQSPATSFNAGGGIEVFHSIKAKGPVEMSTGYAGMTMGQEDKDPIRMDVDGSFVSSGARLDILNASLYATDSITLNPAQCFTIGTDLSTASLFSGQPMTLNGDNGIVVHSANLGSEKSVTLNAGHNKITFYDHKTGSQFQSPATSFNAGGGIEVFHSIKAKGPVEMSTGYAGMTMGQEDKDPIRMDVDGSFVSSGARLDILNASLYATDSITLNPAQCFTIGHHSADTSITSDGFLSLNGNSGIAFMRAILEGKTGIEVNVAQNHLTLGHCEKAPVFKTNGLATFNAGGGINIVRSLAVEGSVQMNTGWNPLILGEAGLDPVRVCITGHFGFSGTTIRVVNGGIFAQGGMTLIASHGLTLGQSLIYRQPNGPEIHPIGSGDYLVTRGDFILRSSPFFHLIGGHLEARNAYLYTPTFKNIGGLVDIKGNLEGYVNSLANELLPMSQEHYASHSQRPDLYRDYCLTKLPRGRLQIGGSLKLPWLEKGVNWGSDLYVGVDSLTHTPIQSKRYNQVPNQTSAFLREDEVNLYEKLHYWHLYPTQQEIERFRILQAYHAGRGNENYFMTAVNTIGYERDQRDCTPSNYTRLTFSPSGSTPHQLAFVDENGLVKPTPDEIDFFSSYVNLTGDWQSKQRVWNHTLNWQQFSTFKQLIDNRVATRAYQASLSVLPTHSCAGTLVLSKADHLVIDTIHQASKILIEANTLQVGRPLNPFEAGFSAFDPVQNLSQFHRFTKMEEVNLNNTIALISPQDMLRVDPTLFPEPVIVTPTQLILNTQSYPRLYDPYFEMNQVVAAIQKNLGHGYLDAQTTTPEAIYHRLLQNAQDLYQQYQAQLPFSNALPENATKITLIESSFVTLPNGQKVPLQEPVLIYDIVKMDNKDALQGHIVWPLEYGEKTKNLRDNRGGLIGDNILLKANTLQIEGRLHTNTTGAYQTQNTIINGGTLSSGKDSTTVLQAQKLLIMQPTERVNELGIKETVFAKVESQGRTGIEAGVMEIKAGQISSTSTDPKAMLLQGNNARLGAVKTIHAIENGTKETAEVTTISSKGGTTLQFGQSLVGEAPYLEGKNLKVTAPKIEMIPVTLRQEQQWTEIKESWWQDTEKTIHKIIETNILPHYKAIENITFTGDQIHHAPKIDAPKTVFSSPHGTVELKQAAQHQQIGIQESSSSLVFNKQKIERHDHLTYLSPQITGDLSIEARKAIVEEVEGLLSPKIRVKGTLTNSILSEVHNVDVKSSRTLGGALSALTALAITVGTGGLGASVVGAVGLGGNTLVIGVGQALVTGTATQLTLGTLNNDFNPVKGIVGIGTKEGSLSLATSIVSSGVMGSMGITAPGLNASMTDITRYAGTKTLVSSGINLAFNNNSLEETLRKVGINFVTDIVGVMGANYLGELYQNGKGSIDFATHKILHGVLGAGLGSLKGDPLAGALGGMVAETVADLISDDVEDIAVRVYEKAESQGIEFGSQAYNDIAREEVQATVNWSKVGAILAVSLAKRDIDVGVDVATNALENNFTKYIVQGIKYLSNKWGKDGAKKATQQTTDTIGKNSAKNRATHEKYKEGLKQEQKTAEQSHKAQELLERFKTEKVEEMAGPKTGKIVKDEPRLVCEYGGKPGDWAKIKGQNHRLENGEKMEVHGYQNLKTGKIVEPKIKIQ